MYQVAAEASRERVSLREEYVQLQDELRNTHKELYDYAASLMTLKRSLDEADDVDDSSAAAQPTMGMGLSSHDLMVVRAQGNGADADLPTGTTFSSLMLL